MVLTRALLTMALVPLFVAAPASRTQNTDFETKMTDADTLLARRQYEDALRTYKAANALQDKKSARAHLGMARAYHGLKAHKSAADSCTDALKYVGDDKTLEGSARNTRAISLFALVEKPDDKRWKQIEEDFRFVMGLGDQYPVAQYNLGLSLLRQKRDDEGIRELQAFLTRARNVAEVNHAKRYIENPRRARENYAPDFSFSTLDGEFLSSEDLAGKVVLLDFWATWCAPCVEATPGLARLQKKYKDDPLVIIGVSADRSQEPWKQFIDKHKLTWVHYYDEKRTMASRFGVGGFPTYILIDHEGIIRYRQQGWNPGVDGEIEGEMRSLLKRAKAARQ